MTGAETWTVIQATRDAETERLRTITHHVLVPVAGRPRRRVAASRSWSHTTPTQRTYCGVPASRDDVQASYVESCDSTGWPVCAVCRAALGGVR